MPVFEKMFADFGGALPAPTQFVVDLSAWLQDYISTWSAGIAGGGGLHRPLPQPEGPRASSTSSILKVPLIGDVIRKVAVARFTRTLGTMISSGVPILDALDVTAKTAGNRTIEAAISYVRTKISEGKNIAGPLADTKVFPSMVVQMIGVGEATGAMDQMLNKIADFYDDEVDTSVGVAHGADRAAHDGLPRRRGRRLPDRHVPADLHHRQRHQVAAPPARPSRGGTSAPGCLGAGVSHGGDQPDSGRHRGAGTLAGEPARRALHPRRLLLRSWWGSCTSSPSRTAVVVRTRPRRGA